MGIQNPQLIDITSVSLEGFLRSGNIHIPTTSETDYLFDSAYLPSESPIAMRAYYPDTRTSYMVQNFNRAYPGLEWQQPLWALGGDGPVIYEIVQAPFGVSIGTKVARDPVTGYFKPGETYGNLIWQNPAAGRYRFCIRATAQLTGRWVYWIFDLIVNTDDHYFMALNATGNGSGSSPANYASYANTILGQTTVSPCRNKVLHIKGDSYPATAGINANTAYVAASWVSMPGEYPVFTQKVNVTSDNISFYGIEFFAVGTSDFGVIGSQGVVNNFGLWRCTFNECYMIGSPGGNQSCVGFNKSGNGFGRKTIFVSECKFKNSTTIHGYDYYTVADNVWARNELIITNGTTVLTSSWIFPKMMVNNSHIVYNKADVPGCTTITDSIAQLYNAWDESHPISFDLTNVFEYNYIRTGGAACLKSNGADNNSPLPSVVRNIIRRNTFVGGSVTAVNYRAYSGYADRKTDLESNVYQNPVGGPTIPASSSDWFYNHGTNAQGNAGIVDSYGHPLTTSLSGKTGHGIWRPE